jgi:hypothetical protein
MDIAIPTGSLSVCRLLVSEYQIDPFQSKVPDENNGNDGDGDETSRGTAISSPFLVFCRQSDTNIFGFFLELWDKPFSSSPKENGVGKNRGGDLPIHVVCCEASVSMQAIKQWLTTNMASCQFSLLPCVMQVWMSSFSCCSTIPMLCVILEMLQRMPRTL